MTELRINGFIRVRTIIKSLLPYIRFKKDQASALYKAADLLSRKTEKHLDTLELLSVVDCILKIQNENYATRSKKSKEELLHLLALTP